MVKFWRAAAVRLPLRSAISNDEFPTQDVMLLVGRGGDKGCQPLSWYGLEGVSPLMRLTFIEASDSDETTDSVYVLFAIICHASTLPGCAW